MQLDRCCVWLLVKKNSHIKIKLFHHQNPTVNKWALLQHRHGMVFLYCQYLLTSLAADKQCLPAQLIDLWERFLISNQKNTLMFAHIIVYVGQSEVRKIWVSYGRFMMLNWKKFDIQHKNIFKSYLRRILLIKRFVCSARSD